MMEKRVFLAVLMTVIVIAFWQQSTLPPANEKKPDEAASETETGKPVEVPPDRETGDGATGPATGEVEPAKPPVAPELVVAASAPFDGDLVLSNGHLRFRFDQMGGAVDSAWLLDHRADPDDMPADDFEGSLKFIQSPNGGPKALSLLDGDAAQYRSAEAWMNDVPWATEGVAADRKSIEFRLDFTRKGVAFRLVRRYAFGEAPNRLQVSLRLESRGTLEQNEYVSLWLRNTNGVIPEKRALLSTIPARSVVGVLDESEVVPTAFTTKDLTGADDESKSVSNARYAADMGFYFTSILSRSSNEAIEGARVAMGTGAGGVKRTHSELRVALTIGPDQPVVEQQFDLYIGPKDHRLIRENYAAGADQDMFLALSDSELMAQNFCPCAAGPMELVVKVISKAVVWALSFFGGLFGNYGIAIIVLTIIVRGLMFP
ncbi:MAG: hypothetical protein KDB53_15890, partial [Planctomycetes bacterium]|nr:hypothetical protein [Planctomycetota bacterium]